MVYLNGAIVPPEKAFISVFDRGFLYGDSVYETLRVYDGKPFALAQHLVRLRESGARIGYDIPWSTEELRAAVAEALAASGYSEASIRVIATRGRGALAIDPAMAYDPQLVVLAQGLPDLPDSLYTEGRSATLVSIQRNSKLAIDPAAKTGNYMNSVLAVREAKARGSDEAIMLDVDGRVAEGSSANVFARIDGSWVTPGGAVGILHGITRKTVLEVLSSDVKPATETDVWPNDFRRSSAIFLCSSVRELVPIVRLDESPVGDGSVGDEFRRVLELYRSEVRRQLKDGAT